MHENKAVLRLLKQFMLLELVDKKEFKPRRDK